jgi:hypothetical protein
LLIKEQQSILPFHRFGSLKLALKEVFHGWYKYSTRKGVNINLIRAGKANAEQVVVGVKPFLS